MWEMLGFECDDYITETEDNLVRNARGENIEDEGYEPGWDNSLHPNAVRPRY